MSKITQTFKNLKLKGQKALIPYVSCGDPSLEFTEKLVLKLADAGADIIELGIPYSDPVADGPTIQKAAQRALAGGISLEKIFGLVASLRERIQTPLILMTYFNPIYRYGLEKFVFRALQARVDGIIVPDLPPEEAGTLKEITNSANMDLIFLVAPTSTDHRMKKIGVLASGFIYCVSVTGVTGSRENIASGLDTFLKRVRSHTDLPLAVGFGISSPETARQAAQVADGVIVGSSIIELIEKNLDLINSAPEIVIDEVCSYVASLKKAIF
ncbi:MAG: tryptophan synthase subunit alpha [Bacillota bacterium]